MRFDCLEFFSAFTEPIPFLIPTQAKPRMRSDHVLAGREDLVKLTGLTEERTQLDYLHGLGLPSVVLKLGARSAVNVTPRMTIR